ncbi:hypothetical protein EGW08_014176, partial [Elysia chlorotica]
ILCSTLFSNHPFFVCQEPPFVFRNDSDPDSITYHGYSIDVLSEIAKKVGFEYNFVECSPGGYGFLEDGKWTGCIGNVVRGEADVIIGALTVTVERDKVMDFTLPYYDFAGIQIMMKREDSSTKLYYYASVFTTPAWLSIFGVLGVTSILLWAFERITQSNRKKDSRAFSKESHTNANQALIQTDQSLRSPGGGDPPRSLAGRVLVAGFWFFTVIIMSTFTANLAAFLTVSRLGTSVSSLEDLAAQKEINYSAVRDSSVMEYFKRMATIESNFYEDWKSTSLRERTDQESSAVWDYPLGNKYNALWKAIQRNGLIDTNENGLNKVKAGGFALITESPVIRYYTGLHCDLQAVGEQFSTRPYAIGLKENFPYTGKFSQAILDLQKDRVLGDLQFKWWKDNSACSTDDANAGLGLYLLSGTFIVAGVGLALGVLTLALEHVIVKVKGLQVKKSATVKLDRPSLRAIQKFK